MDELFWGKTKLPEYILEKKGNFTNFQACSTFGVHF